MCVFFFSFPFFLPTSEGSFAWGSGQRVAVRCLSMLSREQGDGSESAAAALLPRCCFFHCRPPPFSSTKAIWTYYFKREKEKKKEENQIPPSATLPRSGGGSLQRNAHVLVGPVNRKEMCRLCPTGLGCPAGLLHFSCFLMCVLSRTRFFRLLIKPAFEPPGL